MTFDARHNAVRVADGFGGAAARVNQAGELIMTPWLTQMALEGRIFLAGHGHQEAAVTGQTAVDDQTPTFALAAPAVDTVVIPLWVNLYFHAEGGAAPNWNFSYVQRTSALVGAGTNFTSLNALGGTDPSSAQATFQHTLTSITAITDPQNVIISRRQLILDNLISAEGVATDANLESTGLSIYEYDWVPPFPITLWKGSGIMFHCDTGTTGSDYKVSAAWLELPSGVYVPEGRV